MPDQFENPRALRLNDFEISDSSECFVIAEVGSNHGGSLESAHEHFTEAKAAGAHAVKLQKRDNRSLYTREGYAKPYENENSYGATYGEHREALEFGKAEYEDLIAHAKEIGITFFSTAFDIPSADFLAELDMPLYKIASADLINTPLLKHVAKAGKPIILSTGGATLEDVKRGYSAVAEINPQVALLQCTAGYPAAWEELDLRVISTYRDLFPDSVVGLSSHDNGIAMAVAAYVLGGRIVEKHFTLNRALKGTDHRFSLEPQGLRKLVRDLKRTRVALGDGNKSMYPSETDPIIKMAKKLVAARDLSAGHTLTEADIAFKSPGDGLPPYELDRVLGRTLRHPVQEDSALTFELLEEAGAQVGSSTTVTDLAGQVAVVTGAAGRLGPVWAQALAEAGATVVGIDLAEGRLAGNPIEVADVTDRAAMTAARDAITARHGVPSILVNNAGIDQPPDAGASRYRIEDVPLEDFTRTTDVNLGGTFNAIQVFGAAMVAEGRGSIVNIGSLYASIAPEPRFYDHLPGDPPFLKPAAYGASKAAVLNLTRYFARLWGPHGVRVNAISPGGVEGGQDEQFLAKYTARVPLGRLAQEADLGGPLVFLASEASRYVTGHHLQVDGGFTA